MLAVENIAPRHDYGSPIVNRVADQSNKSVSCPTIRSCGTVYGGPLSSVSEISCTRFLCQSLREGRDKPFLIDGTNGYRLTYDETLKVVKRGSRWFADNIKEGDIVCLYARNAPHYITAILAITAAGGSTFHVNWEFTSDELEYSLSSLKGVVAILANTINAPKAAKLAKDKGLKLILFTNGQDNTMKEDALSYEEDIVSGWSEESSELEDNWAKLSRHPKETIFQILSSSGTTGMPKKVLTTHYARMANITQLSEPNQSFFVPEGDTMLLVTPLHVMFGTVLWTHALTQHATIVTNPDFRPDIFLSTIQNYKCTMLPIAPSMAILLLESPLTDRYDLTSLKRVIKAGMTMADSIAERLVKKFNLEYFRQAYGMTEAGHVMVFPPNNEDIRSIGFLAPGTEMQVREMKSNLTLGPNQVGEFWIRGPQLMLGYMDLPNVFDENGWLRTGDVGYYNDAGFFYYVERVKDILKVRGHQVPPAELEYVLMKHPLVRDCAVVGKPDLIAGEYPAAFVVLKDKATEDGNVSEEELAKDIQSFLANKSRIQDQALARGSSFRGPDTTNRVWKDYQNHTKTLDTM